MVLASKDVAGESTSLDFNLADALKNLRCFQLVKTLYCSIVKLRNFYLIQYLADNLIGYDVVGFCLVSEADTMT